MRTLRRELLCGGNLFEEGTSLRREPLCGGNLFEEGTFSV